MFLFIRPALFIHQSFEEAPEMARPRTLTDEQRAAHKKASRAKWREDNRDYIRQKAAESRALPGAAKLHREYRQALYRRQREALLASGWVPNPVGRPRIRTPEEAEEIHRRASREFMRRTRDLRLAAVESARSSEQIGQ